MLQELVINAWVQSICILEPLFFTVEDRAPVSLWVWQSDPVVIVDKVVGISYVDKVVEIILVK